MPEMLQGRQNFNLTMPKMSKEIYLEHEKFMYFWNTETSKFGTCLFHEKHSLFVMDVDV